MVRDSSVLPKAVLTRTIALSSNRWIFLTAVLLALSLISPFPLAAYEIAILKSSDIAAYNQAVVSFQSEIKDSATVTVHDMEGDLARGKKLARKIRASDATLVIAVGLKAALAAKVEIVDVPVIYCMVLDPEKYDLKAPNLTGISLRIPVERQLSTIHALVPKLKRVGVLYDPEKTSPLIDEARRVATRLGLELIEKPIHAEKEVPAATRTLLGSVDGLWLVPDSTVLTEDSIKFILGASLDRNIPVLGFSAEFVRNGALAGLSINPEDVGRQAAIIAKKLLRTSDHSVPVTALPDRIRLAVNLKTAKYLGLTLPPDVMGKADEVY